MNEAKMEAPQVAIGLRIEHPDGKVENVNLTGTLETPKEKEDERNTADD